MTAIRMLSSALLLVLMQSGALCARRFRGGRNPPPRRTPAPPPAHRADRGDTTESFPLDFTAVEENMDNFMTQVKNLAQSLYPCSAQKLDHDMKLHFLENASVTCNDASPAGYVPTPSGALPCARGSVWPRHREVKAGGSRAAWSYSEKWYIRLKRILRQGAPHPAARSEPTYLARGQQCSSL